jgi:hypothetical protein
VVAGGGGGVAAVMWSDGRSVTVRLIVIHATFYWNLVIMKKLWVHDGFQ